MGIYGFWLQLKSNWNSCWSHFLTNDSSSSSAGHPYSAKHLRHFLILMLCWNRAGVYVKGIPTDMHRILVSLDIPVDLDLPLIKSCTLRILIRLYLRAVIVNQGAALRSFQRCYRCQAVFTLLGVHTIHIINLKISNRHL